MGVHEGGVLHEGLRVMRDRVWSPAEGGCGPAKVVAVPQKVAFTRLGGVYLRQVGL